jgi:hypothetical protein
MSAFPSRAWTAEDAEERFAALSDMTWRTFSWFLAKGVPSPALVYPEMPRMARVAFSRGLFDFADEGADDSAEAMIFLARNCFQETCGRLPAGCQ